MDLKKLIPVIPDWPKAGVDFLDVTALLEDPAAFSYCTSWLVENIHQIGATSLIAVESRGFPFAAAAARLAHIPLILARKAGKLPGKVYSESYTTEYSTDTIEIKAGSHPGTHPIIVDDLLATGGTVTAVARLLRKNFKTDNVFAATVINLQFLSGTSVLALNNINYTSLVTYE